MKTTVYHVTEQGVSGKIKNAGALAEIARQARRDGKTVVFTNGCFDLLHRGHVHTLRQAKAQGDILIVAVNSDASVRAIKGPARPVVSEDDRIELIAALEMVDYVVKFEDPDPCKLLETIQPDVLAKGGDWGADGVVGADIVRAAGGRVALIPYLQGYSTTEIIERIQN